MSKYPKITLRVSQELREACGRAGPAKMREALNQLLPKPVPNCTPAEWAQKYSEVLGSNPTYLTRVMAEHYTNGFFEERAKNKTS